jgi:hypothetical protein
MKDELDRSLRRWLAADDEDRDDEAESAFRTVFASAVESAPVSSGFTARTMASVGEASARDRRAARRTRVAMVWLGISGGALLTYLSAGVIVSAASTALTGLLDLLIGTVVGAATSGQSGTSVWTVFTSLGRAAAAFASSPKVTVTILGIQAIAIAALVALQRLLGSDWESFK